MKRNKKKGFSLLEVIAAVVILAVVAAATVATIAPMRQKSEDKLDIQQVATLNAMAQTYYLENGNYPNNTTQLGQAGYLPWETAVDRSNTRAMGNKYQYNATTGVFAVTP